jgi:lipopolysaccharide transport system permease protein
MVLKNILHHRFFENFLKYRYLLMELVKRDIKVRYRRSVLGIFWSFLEPLLFMIVLTIIFSTLFSRSIENYPVFLLSGRLVFMYFSQSTNGAMRSIKMNSPILKKLYVPKYIYTIALTLSALVTFLLSLIVLVMVMLATGAPFTPYIALFIVPTVLLTVFNIGVGLILATINVFFRDMEHLYGVFLTLLMYSSAIFFPPDVIPVDFQWILTWNPVYAMISLTRDLFLYGQMFDTFTLIFATISAIASLVIGLVLFYKYQDKFILHV